MIEWKIQGWIEDPERVSLPPLLNVTAAAAACGLTPARLSELVDALAVPHVRIDNGPPLFFASDLKTFVKRHLIKFIPPSRPLPEPVIVYLSDHPKAVNIPTALAEYADRIVSLPHEPPMCGVYFLLVDESVKYVGSTTNLRGRLAAHWAGGKRWNRLLFMTTLPDERLRIEYGFIRALRPDWNNSGKGGQILTDDETMAPTTNGRVAIDTPTPPVVGGAVSRSEHDADRRA